MRTKRIIKRKKPALLIQPEYSIRGGILTMHNANLFATLSSSNVQTFTAQIAEDGTIYKYDYATQSNIPVGVDQKTWNSMVDEKEQYYKLGLEHGYIKTPEQIAEEEKLAKELKEKEDAKLKEDMAEMLETIKALKSEVASFKGGNNNNGLQHNTQPVYTNVPQPQNQN